MDRSTVEVAMIAALREMTEADRRLILAISQRMAALSPQEPARSAAGRPHRRLEGSA